MASVFISSILKATSHWLSLIRDTPSASSTTITVVEDLERLKRMLQRIKMVLVDAEERQIVDQSVMLWLKEIKDVAYDAEDLLDEYQYEVLRTQVENRKRTRVEGDEEVIPLASFPSNIAAIKISVLSSMADRIKKLRKRIKEISNDRRDLHLKPEDGERWRDSSSQYPPPTGHMIIEQEICGREDDKNKLIDRLFTDLESKKFEVIAVVGKGGLGKTTLTQLVYNDQKVKEYFEKKMWICVSDDFNLARLTRAMIESIRKEACTLADQLSPLQESLHKELKGKKVLLVLDDVWNENTSLWESLIIPFHGAEMVRIIVTTRNESVSDIMRIKDPCSLGYLPEDQCWQLFVSLAFCGRDPEQFPLLVHIGKKIVKKCDGLPLAVKSLGGLLQHEIDEDKWNEVLDSNLWDKNTNILPALLLSYVRMPSHLKPCFEICSMFPKDYEFSKDELVKLWAAHGYIQHHGEKKDADEIGYTYFNELQRRSFFDEFHRYRYRENTYKMHDNIHDLAHYVHVKMYLSNSIEHKIRHLTIKNEPSEFYLNDIEALKTLIVLRGNNIDINHMLRGKLTHLRYLDIKHYMSREEILLADGIRNLIFLRHLELYTYKNLKLPKSIGILYNLVVMEITCHGLVEVPEMLRNLVSLTTIHFCGFRNDQLPALGQLPSLKFVTLKEFKNVKRIGNEFCRGGNNRCSVGFPSLTSLVFEELTNWVKWDELQEGDFPRLQKLQILGSDSLQLWPVGSFPKVLETLESSSHLKLSLPRGFEELKKLERLIGKFLVKIDEVFGILKNLVSLRYLILSNGDSAWYAREYTSIGLFSEQNEFLHLVVEVSHNEGKHHSDREDASFSLLKHFPPETFVNLASLNTIYFYGLHIDHLPALGQLPSLKSITLKKLDNVKSIGNDFSRGRNNRSCVAFPSLTSLVFEELTSWEKWVDELQEGDFSQLQKLQINRCRRLTSLPSLGNLTMLWCMSLNKCYSLRLLPEGSFPPNLKTLESSYHSKLSLPGGFEEVNKLESLSGRFGVRIDKVYGILKNLVDLKWLILSELRNAHTARNEEACISEYSGIEKLVLDWSLSYEAGTSGGLHLVIEGDQNKGSLEELYKTEDDDLISDDNGTNEIDNSSFFVLEKLQPHVNLRELNIEGYNGVGYPRWIGHPSFDRLTKINLRNCINDQLPTLGQLPSLQELCLDSFSGLKRIGAEFCRGINEFSIGQNNRRCVAFPSLISLIFEELTSWEKWVDELQEGDFSQLQKLQINRCYRLSSLPSLGNLTMLRCMSLNKCYSLRLLPEGSFPPNLKTLESSYRSKLSLPGGFEEVNKLESLSGRFGVSIDKVYGILKNLVDLKWLTLSELRNAHTAWNDEACLREYSGIEKLVLDWSLSYEAGTSRGLHLVIERNQNKGSLKELYKTEEDDLISDDHATKEIDNSSFFVLEKLQPHVNLGELNIEGYDGVGYPSWIGHSSFDRLTKINLRNCITDQLPTLGQLPSLQELCLDSFSGLKRIGAEFCRGTNHNDNVTVAFPSLKCLRFRGMHDWKKWHGVLDEDFPLLEILIIEDCPSIPIDPEFFPRRLLKYLYDEYAECYYEY